MATTTGAGPLAINRAVFSAIVLGWSSIQIVVRNRDDIGDTEHRVQRFRGTPFICDQRWANVGRPLNGARTPARRKLSGLGSYGSVFHHSIEALERTLFWQDFSFSSLPEFRHVPTCHLGHDF